MPNTICCEHETLIHAVIKATCQLYEVKLKLEAAQHPYRPTPKETWLPTGNLRPSPRCEPEIHLGSMSTKKIVRRHLVTEIFRLI